MNYDLAIMALEGLARSPLGVSGGGDREVVIEADSAAFKELARLCLLLGGAHSGEDEFALDPGVHVTTVSPGLRLRLRVE